MRFAPRIPAWHLSRSGLVDRLESGVASGLVIVRGGSGVGKSAALAEWASRTPRAGVWVTVHDAISSRFALWAHVLVAAGDARAAALESAQEAQLRLVLAESLGAGRVTVVLDDYHLVGDPRVHDDIEWLVANAGGSVVIGTRVVPPFEQMSGAARLDPVVIAPDDLVFAPEETVTYLGLRHRLPARVAAEAHERLAGWPLALRSLDLELSRRGESAPWEAALLSVEEGLVGSHPTLPHTLRDPEMLAFAARAAIAEWLTADLARELTGRTDAAELLGVFEREGLGSWRSQLSGRVFVLAPFVRSAIRPAAADLDATTVQRLRRVYATWADRAGHSVIAGRQAVELGDWALLAALSQRHFRQLMRLHRAEWRKLVAVVPLDRLRRHPVLGTVALQLLNAESAPSDRLRALATTLVNSIAPMRERGSTPDRIWRNASTLAAERITGRYGAASATAERLTALIAALGPDDLDQIEEFLPLLYVHIGTTRLYDGDAVGAREPLAEAVRSSADAPWSGLHARSMLALTSALRGELRNAEELVLAVEDCEITGWRGTYSAAGYHLARTMLKIEEFDPQGAREELRLLAGHFDTIEHWPLLLRFDALAAQLEGSAAAAAAVLPDRIRLRSRRAGTSAGMRAMLTSTHAELLLAAGDLRAAEQVLSRNDADAPVVVLSSARAALVTGDDARALALAARLLEPTGTSPRLASAALLVRAVAQYRSGRHGDAVVALTTAVGMMHTEGLRTPLLLLPRASLLGLREALSARDAARLDALLDGAPDPTPAAAAARIVRLTERENAVLAELARSGSVRSISAALYVSPNTIKSQLRTLYRKLGVSNRDEALLAATAEGLLRST